jgi:hypothetical protein
MFLPILTGFVRRCLRVSSDLLPQKAVLNTWPLQGVLLHN